MMYQTTRPTHERNVLIYTSIMLTYSDSNVLKISQLNSESNNTTDLLCTNLIYSNYIQGGNKYKLYTSSKATNS